MTVIRGADNSNGANVTDDNQLEVCAATETSVEFASKKKEKAYTWSSSYSATANDEVISLKNTSTSDALIIDEVIVGASVATVFTLFKVTSGTAAGTTITGVNSNLKSGASASATAFGDASVTGSLTGDTVAYGGVVANEFQVLDLKGALVLGPNNEVSVTASATGTVYITIIGHYKGA